jgi:hypothetical protein
MGYSANALWIASWRQWQKIVQQPFPEFTELKTSVGISWVNIYHWSSPQEQWIWRVLNSVDKK